LAFACHTTLGAAIAGLFAVVAKHRSESIGVLAEALRPDVGGAVFVGGLVAAMEAASQRGDDPVVTNLDDRRLATLTGLALFLVMAVAPGARVVTSSSGSLGLALAGALLCLAGGVLRARSIRVLGESFVTDPSKSRAVLVATDVYARLRHPSELGLYAICLGMNLMSPSIIAGFGAFAVVVLAHRRVRREDALLRDMFGATHERYCAEVPAIGWARSRRST
jgi:protein-S-isoprenylcysteine O-methyltransferase Ste14